MLKVFLNTYLFTCLPINKLFRLGKCQVIISAFLVKIDFEDADIRYVASPCSANCNTTSWDLEEMHVSWGMSCQSRKTWQDA